MYLAVRHTHNFGGASERRMIRCCVQPLPQFHGCPREQAAEAVVNRILQVLFAAQISLGGQDGHMTEEELNLLQLATIHMAELGACSAKIVWCEMV